MIEKRQFCTFFIDGFFYGVEVEKVQEILRPQPMTPVPLAASAVMGLINLRGQIVTAIDLRRRLGRTVLASGQHPINLVLRTDYGPVSLLVDEVGDVVEVEESHFERPPETLQGDLRSLIRGAYKRDDRLLLILDTENTLIFPDAHDAR
jgi:purine-binding chemotaxis protein CheW